MRKIIPALLFGALFMSCIDKDYDLSKIDTDDITVGGETSKLEMPLATVLIRMDEFTDGETDIQAIFDEVDIWLPAQLPGENALDLTRLHPGSTYTNQVLDALFAQLQSDDAKLTQLTDLVWEKYSPEFLPLLGLPGNPTEAVFKSTFKTTFRQSDDIQVKAREVASGYLTEIRVDDLHYTIDKFDISSDIVDMLADNLDPRDKADAKNTLHLYGTIESRLPLHYGITPDFVGTDVSFQAGIGPDASSDIPETRVYEDDLRTIIGGIDIVIPVTLEKYYPVPGFSRDQEVHIYLKLRKCGGLTLNL